MDALLLFAITGAAAGLLAGLFGVGGGLIMVPALAVLLPRQGVVAAQTMQVAIATSLAVIAFTSLSSTRSHWRRGGVRWDALRGLAPGLALGALVGAFVAHGLSARALELLVGGGAILVAAQMVLSRPPAAKGSTPVTGDPALIGHRSGTAAGGSATAPPGAMAQAITDEPAFTDADAEAEAIAKAQAARAAAAAPASGSNRVVSPALVVPNPAAVAAQPAPPVPELLAAGGAIGLLSSLVGIGGGSLTVPYLAGRGLPMVQAVGTAAAGGVPIAWAGALGFVISGWTLTGWSPIPQLGYVNGWGFAGLVVFSTLTAPWGARLAHQLPPLLLKRAFAALLAATGVAMLLR